MDLQQILKEIVPGSIWLRTDGSKARVLAVTNLSLPADRQQKYVPDVVYVGPSGNVFSRPIRDFVRYFPTWLGFDAAAEKAITALTAPLTAPQPKIALKEEDSYDNEPVSAVEASVPREKPVVQVREKVSADNKPKPMPSLMRAAFKISDNPDVKTPAATADQLSASLRLYSQVPDEHLGLVVHKLSFQLSPQLTIDMLKEVFCPNENVNTVDIFRIGTPVSDETVGVDAYMGVYPEFTRNVLYGTVYIGADMQPSAPLVEHTHEITQGPATGNAEIQAVAQEPDVSEVPVHNPPEVAENVEQPAQDQTTTSEYVSGTGGEAAVASEAIPSENGEKPDDTPSVPAKKPRKKRTPKKKVVNESVATDDDELDVANLS